VTEKPAEPTISETDEVTDSKPAEIMTIYGRQLLTEEQNAKTGTDSILGSARSVSATMPLSTTQSGF